MNRTIIYSQEQPRSFDFVQFEHDVLLGLAFSTQDILGQTTTVISGLAATQTGPATLTINLASGRCYQQAQADATPVGAIAQDTSVIEQQGFYTGAQITLSTSGIAGGQSRWSLVEAQFSQTDVVRAGDPNGGIPPFYNAANPAEPLNGQGGLGLTSPTERQGLCILQVINGSAATTGAEVPPNPTSGWVPLYLIDLTNGQTQITSGEILVAGPSVGTNVPSNYPYAPFLAGLLSSHHSGNPGQAPKINLTSAAEVAGLLPFANLAAFAGSFASLPISIELPGGVWIQCGVTGILAQNAHATVALPQAYASTSTFVVLSTPAVSAGTENGQASSAQTGADSGHITVSNTSSAANSFAIFWATLGKA